MSTTGIIIIILQVIVAAIQIINVRMGIKIRKELWDTHQRQFKINENLKEINKLLNDRI